MQILIIAEYIDLQNISLVTSWNDSSGFYLPHHCMLRDSSTTTRSRPVFDGSAKSSSDFSFNDQLFVGPTVENDLPSIALRFRSYPIVLSADTEEMYRHVLVSSEPRHLQKILWRSNSSLPSLQTYELNTITYGTVSSAYLATRCLRKVGLLLKDFDNKVSSIIFTIFMPRTCWQVAILLVMLAQKLKFLIIWNLRKWSPSVSDLADTNTVYNLIHCNLIKHLDQFGIHHLIS